LAEPLDFAGIVAPAGMSLFEVRPPNLVQYSRFVVYSPGDGLYVKSLKIGVREQIVTTGVGIPMSAFYVGRYPAVQFDSMDKDTSAFLTIYNETRRPLGFMARFESGREQVSELIT
jgi:hypothetical protein